VPVLGIVQLGAASRADRYMYFPHVGLFLLVGSLPVFQKKISLIAVTSTLLAVAMVSSILTWHQSQIWRDSISLWQACLNVDPDNYRGHDQLALALLVDEQVEEALRESQVAMQYLENQSYGGTHTTLGCAQLFSGDVENAVTNLREAIRIRPDDHRALINLGYALRLSDLAESKRLFTQALQYSPMNVEAMGNLANCEAEDGNFSAAIELLKTAIKIDSDNAQLKENLRTFQEAERLNLSH
jgi:tetratricopeptide (TPR) repeat protein